MNKIQDKVIGSWFGMVVGDAMGAAARGLKPATIRQCFRQMDGFKDVGPFVGKGVKQYKMRGLYGAPTQSALIFCDTLLKHKKIDLNEIVLRFQQLTQGGPENYFGVYRRPDACLRKTVASFSQRSSLNREDMNFAAGTGLVTAVPIALFYQGRVAAIKKQCREACMLMSRNPWEITGAALVGFLIDQFLSLEADQGEAPDPAVAENILRSAADFCEETESWLKNQPPWDDIPEKDLPALSRAFRLLGENWRKLELKDFPALICQNASTYVKGPVSHAAQGYVVTLLPLAVLMVLKGGNDFAPALTSVLDMGGEADKLGAVTGALAGALYGFSRIPPSWQSGLVNAGQIKSRGEALLARRFPAGLKDLYEMESNLTLKECEERKKYLRLQPRKPRRKTAEPIVRAEKDSADVAISKKDDPAQWRKHQKDKTRKKRERRKNLAKGF